MAGRLLLDTHVWFRFLEGSRKDVAPSLQRRLQRAGSQSQLAVSIMSIWEVAMLESKGRIRLSLDCLSWMDRALTAPGIHLQEITSAIAIESTRLPGEIHGDPVDRILVATARIMGATFVTRDEPILKYAAQGHLKVIDARQ